MCRIPTHSELDCLLGCRVECNAACLILAVNTHTESRKNTLTIYIASKSEVETALGLRKKLRWRCVFFGAALFALNVDLSAQTATGAAPVATLLTVQDAIGPATSSYIRDGIESAAQNDSQMVVLQLDTPGGLDTSMREIIQAILAADIPIVTFVYPQGARAASAGTYILYSSHIAAMAPATTTGAATPVAIGGGSNPFSSAPSSEGAPASTDESGAQDDVVNTQERAAVPEPATTSERKSINDAVSFIRGLAEQRNRNAEWAERAVRYAESISAYSALEMNVVDIVASDLSDLFAQLDGRAVSIHGETQVLRTDGIVIEKIEPNWHTRLLSVITNPQIAYILLLIGIYGLVLEGYNPGGIVPGVVGAISLLIALFAFQVLPVNYAGLALIVLGVMLMAAEFFVPSFGALGLGGIASFVFGSLILVDTDIPGFERPTSLIVTLAILAGAGLLGIVWFAMRARARPIVSGIEEMTRQEAVALEDFEQFGSVLAHGERWQAQTNAPIKKGQRLKVVKVDGLHLQVEPFSQT